MNVTSRQSLAVAGNGLAKRGFVLVMVLWLLLAMTAGASALAAWVSRSLDQAQYMADETRARVDMHSTLETVKFLSATHPIRVGGISIATDPAEIRRSLSQDIGGYAMIESDAGDLAVDDRPYRGLGEALFSVQDELGLINPNAFDEMTMDAVLGRQGVPFTQRPVLTSRLRDYTEFRPTRERRLGAGAEDYRVAGRRPPPNRYLITPLEVRQVLGWDEHDSLWEDHFWRDNTTVLAFGNLNLNAVPEPLLAALPGISEEAAGRLIAERRQRPFRSPDEASSRAGVPAVSDSFAFTVLSDDNLRLTVWPQDHNRGFRYHLQLTPQADGRAPWRMRMAYPVNGLNLDRETPQDVAHPLMAPPSDR